MNKEEFIGKLEMVYVGDRNAFNEIVEDNQKLKNEVVYSKVEIDRLNKEYERIYNENCKLRENHNINDITLLDENERLNNIIDTMLEFSFFKEECPLNFGFGDEKEEKAQDVFYEDDYCEENCNDIYKKCWLKYFEKLQALKENNK